MIAPERIFKLFSRHRAPLKLEGSLGQIFVEFFFLDINFLDTIFFINFVKFTITVWFDRDYVEVLRVEPFYEHTN